MHGGGGGGDPREDLAWQRPLIASSLYIAPPSPLLIIYSQVLYIFNNIYMLNILCIYVYIFSYVMVCDAMKLCYDAVMQPMIASWKCNSIECNELS